MQYRDIVFRRIHSTNSDLSQNTPICFLHDRTGFMWIGTQNGLNRFDGTSFKVFHKKAGNNQALLDDWIIGLHQDGAGRLWVMNQQGISLYHPHNHSFRNYINQSLSPISSAPSFSRYTGGIAVDACNDIDGNPWFATEQGVNIFNPKDSSFIMIEDEQRERSKPQSYGWLAHKTTRTLARDSSGTMWIGTVRGLHKSLPRSQSIQTVSLVPDSASNIFDIHVADDGIVWVAGSTGVYRLAQGSQTFINIFDYLPLPFRSNNTCRMIQSDKSGHVWVLLQRGAMMIDKHTLQCTPLISDPLNVQSDENIMSTLITDRHGDVWFGSYNGLVLWQSKTNTAQRMTSEQNDHETIASNYVRSLYEDREGNVWVGSNTGGISLCTERRNRFRVVRSKPGNPQTLTHPSVRAFCEDRSGMIWIGTEFGVSLFDPSRGYVVKQITSADLPRANAGSFSVWAIAQTEDEHLWFGSLHFLVEADKTGKPIRIYTANADDPNALTLGRVRSLMPAPNGDLWVATGNFDARGTNTAQFGGLNCLHRSTGKFTRHWTNVYNSILPTDYIVRVAVRDNSKPHQNSFWVGAQNGVHRFHPDSGIMASYRHDPNNPRSLSSNLVTCLLRTSNGTVWIGTSTGLNLFHEKEEYFTRISIEDGLPDDFIYGIAEDSQGRLWCSTNRGLFCYNPTTKQVRQFTPGDGIQEYEFNAGAYYKSRQGILYFGGIAGINYFQPESVLEFKEYPRVFLTGIQVNNQPFFFDQPLYQLQEITLSHQQNFINIEFASLMYSSSENVRYSYFLEGFDKEWHTVGTRDARSAFYTGLPHGSYTFRIRATGNDGVWSDTFTTLRVIVLPPWWQTIWAKGAYILLSLGAGIGFIQYRETRLRHEKRALQIAVEERTTALEEQKQLLEQQNNAVAQKNVELQKKNEQLKSLHHEKNGMLAVVAHDLKNPLTAILLSAESIAVRTQNNGDERIYNAAKRIEDSAERTVSIITKILDINALETGAMSMIYEQYNISEHLRALLHDYTDRAKRKNISLQTTLPDEDMLFACDKVGILQIADNLISNAIKYTEEHHSVFVSCLTEFREGKHYLVLTIQDEGPGISDADQAQMFQKFRRLSAQPTAGESTTGLGLSIVKSFLDAMDGTIHCHSELGKGTRFVVEIPEHTTESVSSS